MNCRYYNLSLDNSNAKILLQFRHILFINNNVTPYLVLNGVDTVAYVPANSALELLDILPRDYKDFNLAQKNLNVNSLTFNNLGIGAMTIQVYNFGV